MNTTIKADDGHELDCWINEAQAPAKGGLVILQEIFGVTEQLQALASRYSALGFEVAIPALFDRQQRSAVIEFDDAASGRGLMQSAKLDETMADIDAAVQTLRARHQRVAVMGFCWGGGLAVRSAQKLAIDCAIAFYATRLADYLDSPLKAPLLAHFGASDDHVPPELLKQAMEYLPAMQVFMYDAGHAFANDARPSYVAEAAEQAHQRNIDFLHDKIS